MAYVSRRGPSEGPAVDVWADVSDEWVKSHPFLGAFLGDVLYDDGAVRKTGTLLVFVDQGVLKACLSDRDVAEVAFVSASSFEGLMERLEGGLREGALEWRKAGGGGKRRR